MGFFFCTSFGFNSCVHCINYGMVIDIVIKCNRTLATRTLLSHNGDLVVRAVVAGVVG